VRALIVAEDPLHRGALAAARALHRAGWGVGIGSSEHRPLAAWSRSVTWRHHVPALNRDLDAFLRGIKEADAEIGYEVILPAGDAEALAVSFGREGFQATVPYPPHASVVRAFDKLELARRGRRAGFATPHTVLASEDAVLESSLPIVVKARLHWTPETGQAPRRWETAVCTTHDEAFRRVGEIRAGGGTPLLQEFVRGRIMSLSIVVDGAGEIIACVQQLGEQLTWPPGAGIRVRLMTVPVDEGLRRKAVSLLRGLGWIGYANLQLLVSDRPEPLLVDFNGRIVQSFEHAIAAGGNIADMWARLAIGRRSDPAPPPVVGMHFHWLEGDVKRALVERRDGLVRDVFGCLAYALRAKHDFWRWDDPWPAVRYWSNVGGRAVKKLRSRAGTRPGTIDG
jgi:predicted ATP-grasp superfamily ATP-dependent carboligase